MSKQTRSPRVTVPEIAARKGKEKIVCLTADVRAGSFPGSAELYSLRAK